MSEKMEDMTEYCGKLEGWLWQAYYHSRLTTSAYFTALNAHYVNTAQFNNEQQYNNGGPVLNNNYMAPPQPPHQPARVIINNNVPRWQRQPILMFLAAAGIGQGNVGGVAQGQPQTTVSTAIVVKIAPVWKRFLAEVIDFLFLLLVKLFITFTVIDSFELIDLDNIDLDSLRAEAAAGDGDSPQLQNLYDIAFSLTSELLLLELTHRIVVCFFEGYCLWKAGGTPGKTLLGLRVVHAEDVLPFTPQRNNNNGIQQQVPGWDFSGQGVIVRPGTFLTFPRALLRSALKNFSLAFFFPLAFTLFHFENSRTLYDLMAHSIVVEM